MTHFRLFFAARPDATLQEHFSEAARALRSEVGSRTVPPDDLHMTFAFIGEIPVAQLPLAHRIGAALRGSAFTVRFEAYEYWPKPEVIVAAARTIAEPLLLLWQRLHQELAVNGWALETKRLRPHVTLVKKVKQDPVFPPFAPFDWNVASLSLMRAATRGGAQSAYTVVDTWPLLDTGMET